MKAAIARSLRFFLREAIIAATAAVLAAALGIVGAIMVYRTIKWSFFPPPLGQAG